MPFDNDDRKGKKKKFNILLFFSLCSLGSHRLCPSYRKVDPKSVASRVKIELLPELDSGAAVKVEGPDGQGALLVKEEDVIEAATPASNGVKIEDPLDW